MTTRSPWPTCAEMCRYAPVFGDQVPSFGPGVLRCSGVALRRLGRVRDGSGRTRLVEVGAARMDVRLGGKMGAVRHEQRLEHHPLRVATVADAAAVAELLHHFNEEFGDPSPGADVLTRRLSQLLLADTTLALLAGDPPAGVALVTLRPNVWYDVPVALLDELYVLPSLRGHGIGSALIKSCCALLRARGVESMEIPVDGEDRDARRFYERHGFRCVHGDHRDPELYYSRELR